MLLNMANSIKESVRKSDDKSLFPNAQNVDARYSNFVAGNQHNIRIFQAPPWPFLLLLLLTVLLSPLLISRWKATDTTSHRIHEEGNLESIPSGLQVSQVDFKCVFANVNFLFARNWIQKQRCLCMARSESSRSVT